MCLDVQSGHLLLHSYDGGRVRLVCLCMSGRSNTAQTLVLLQPLQPGTLQCWIRVALLLHGP